MNTRVCNNHDAPYTILRTKRSNSAYNVAQLIPLIKYVLNQLVCNLCQLSIQQNQYKCPGYKPRLSMPHERKHPGTWSQNGACFRSCGKPVVSIDRYQDFCTTCSCDFHLNKIYFVSSNVQHFLGMLHPFSSLVFVFEEAGNNQLTVFTNMLSHAFSCELVKNTAFVCNSIRIQSILRIQSDTKA